MLPTNDARIAQSSQPQLFRILSRTHTRKPTNNVARGSKVAHTAIKALGPFFVGGMVPARTSGTDMIGWSTTMMVVLVVSQDSCVHGRVDGRWKRDAVEIAASHG